ncbi:MAG: HAD family hydrolase [Solirubrobacteraceae bacterium]
MGGLSAPDAILLDALGTLLELQPPGPALRRQLAGRFGLEIEEAAAQRAIRAEIAYYRAHHLEGRDRESLADLRRRCTEVLAQALGGPALAPGDLEEAMLASLGFRSFPEVPDALDELRSRGMRLVAVSNWDCSLHDALAAARLAPRLDATIASAEVGAAKPDPAIFERALAAAGVPPAAALHVGDSQREDVEGARAIGIEPVLVLRGGGAPPPGVRGIRSLRELVELAA